MFTFFKANISSLAASFIDYLVYILLVSLNHSHIIMASAGGTVCGGVVNFTVGRNWVFDSKENTLQSQAVRYIIVWSGNLLLNTLGVYLLTKLLNGQYIISKIFVSVMVGFFYNYTLQKRFVFRRVQNVEED